MYPAFVFALFLALCALLTNLTLAYQQRTDDTRTRRVRVQQTRMAEGIDRYVVQAGGPPASLDALTAAPGFEDLRGQRNQWQGYAVSPSLDDGVWKYQRAAAWAVIRKDGGATYATDNACGVGSVTTAPSWCGKNDGVWYRYETKQDYNKEIAQQRMRQQRTLQMLADYWSSHQTFPNTGNDGVAIAAGGARSLALLAGYAGNATNCTGVHIWSGIPLDCAAMFDLWGNPIAYQYQSPTFIQLASESPIRTTDGSALFIGSPLEIKE